MLLFLEQTLDLSSQNYYEQLSEGLREKLSPEQKHRFQLCLARIKSNRTYRYFEAFHEVYDFIQNDSINNDAPFNDAELIALRLLHDQLKAAIVESIEITY